MKRKAILDAAKRVVAEREEGYGSPRRNAFRVAAMWSAFLDYPVAPWQVMPMLALLKLARLSNDPTSKDSWIDLAGYAACGGEVVDDG